ncbi:SigE family RNA polymerase sigma factor [Nocardioides limicola]|uniref:SigE family RNA polymerase sigma factor n=1 Tax=Nocardioides limicola TaxID=2803368 RepID=UPI001EF14989|nr:SigE family RNA polymerase sigma factor [Nocardioides sp. DJM-14]
MPTTVETQGAMATKDDEFARYLAARQTTLLRTAYLITGDPHSAEDLTQTALAKLYLHWHRVRETDRMDAYVRRILVNEHASWWRRGFRRRELSTDVLPEAAVVDEYDDGTTQALWALVRGLPPRQRAVVVLRYYEQRSEAEIAEILEISPGTVKSQCSRALATLRDRLPADIDAEEGR